MQSEFESACTNARDEIAVPEFSLTAVRARKEREAPTKRGRRGVFAAIVVGLSMAAIAAAAVIDHSSFSLTKGGGLLITAPMMKTIAKPKGADVAAAVATMNFKVTLPQGLPAGTNLQTLIEFGSGGLVLGYDLPGSWRRSHHYMNVAILKPSALKGTSQEKHRMMLMFGSTVTFKSKPHIANSVWRIGDEDVFIQTSVLTPAEAAKIKAAMQKEAAR